jgi:ankyrin repeat protein
MNETQEFFRAVEQGDADRVVRLLASNRELARARDGDGATALHHAAFHGHRSLVEILVAAGADLNARDAEHDATPTGWAIHYLRERGGLLAIEIEDVLYAIETRDARWVMRLVTRHPALRDATDRHGTSLATRARESGDAAIAEVFTDDESDAK